MTVLAGFDVAVELSQAVVQELVLSKLRLEGHSLRPPTEIERTISVSAFGATIRANLHALIGSAVVDIGTPAGANSVTVAIDFNDASIEVVGLSPACALDGQITVEVPLLVMGATGGQMTADLTQAVVGVAFSPGATNRLMAAFGTFASQVRPTMETQLQDGIRAAGQQALGPAFVVDNSQPGSLGPPTRFTAVDLVCLYSPDRALQRLCVLAMVQQAPAGDPTTKTDALPPGCAIAVHASPSVVHSIVCDSLMRILHATPPGSCGGAPVAFAGATITGITDMLTDGAIDLSVSARTGGFCYTATGTIPLTLTPAVVNGKLTFDITHGTPTGRVDVEWYCTVVAFVINILVGIAVLIVDGLVDGFAVAMATKLADSLPHQVAIDTPTAPVAGIATELKVAQVTTTELTLGSAVALPSQYPPTPFVGIKTKSTLVKSETVAENDGALICGDDVRIHAVEQRRWYDVQVAVCSHLHGRPLEVTWELECPDTGDVSVLGANGVANGVANLSVDATYGTLLATSVVRQTAHVTWSAGPHGIVLDLTNDPADGSFVLDAKANITNCSGTLTTVRAARVWFQGHITEVTAPGLRQCLDRMLGRFIEIESPVPWPPVEEVVLGPEVFEYVTRLGTSDDEEIHSVVEGVSVALPMLLRVAVEKVQTATAT
jgi:hypothetical protein